MKALIIIDYVNDFVAESGRLTCGEPGQALEGYILGLIGQFSDEGQFVVTATDNHDIDDIYNKEKDMFPPHCFDEQGRALYGEVVKAVQKVKPAQLLEIQKHRYSAFAATPLNLKLQERGVTELHLVGVCTDICVLHTAIDAYNLGYKIVLHTKGVASFNAKGHDAAIDHIKNVLCGEIV